MATTKNMRKKLDYLVRATGRAEADIVAQAVEEGVSRLYAKQVAEAYVAGQIDREKAVQELGKDAIEELDYARESIDADHQVGPGYQRLSLVQRQQRERSNQIDDRQLSCRSNESSW